MTVPTELGLVNTLSPGFVAQLRFCSVLVFAQSDAANMTLWNWDLDRGRWLQETAGRVITATDGRAV